MENSLAYEGNILDALNKLLNIPPFKGVRGMFGLKLNNIQVISTYEKGLLIFDSLGNSHQFKSSLTLTNLEKEFSDCPYFVRTHENFLVNLYQLDYFSPSPSEPQGRTLTFKNTNFTALLSSSNSDKVKKFFNIKSLEHVEPWNEQYQA